MNNPYNQTGQSFLEAPPPVRLTLARTTTADTLPDCRASKNLGVVRGIAVRSRSLLGNFLAGIQTLVGGNITIYTELCEQGRSQAFREMMRHAEMLGANAIVGVRYDSTELMTGLSEVICYGTAIVVEPDAHLHTVAARATSPS